MNKGQTKNLFMFRDVQNRTPNQLVKKQMNNHYETIRAQNKTFFFLMLLTEFSAEDTLSLLDEDVGEEQELSPELVFVIF